MSYLFIFLANKEVPHDFHKCEWMVGRELPLESCCKKENSFFLIVLLVAKESIPKRRFWGAWIIGSIISVKKNSWKGCYILGTKLVGLKQEKDPELYSRFYELSNVVIFIEIVSA